MLHPEGLTPAGVDRRHFVKTLSVAGLALGTAPGLLAAAVTGRRKRYAIVGLGSRYRMYHDAIEKTYQEHAELVALCDKNPGRLALAQKRSGENGAPIPAGYVHTDFDKMIQETKPDVVLVTTMDSTHDDYIVR